MQQKQKQKQNKQSGTPMLKQGIVIAISLIFYIIAAWIMSSTFPKLSSEEAEIVKSTTTGYVKPLLAILFVGVGTGLFGLVVKKNQYVLILAALVWGTFFVIGGRSLMIFYAGLIVALTTILAYRKIRREEELRKIITIIPITKHGIKDVVLAFVVFSSVIYYINVAVPRVSEGIVIPPSVIQAVRAPLQIAVSAILPGVSLEGSVADFKDQIVVEQIEQEAKEQDALPKEVQEVLSRQGYPTTTDGFEQALRENEEVRSTIVRQSGVQIGDATIATKGNEFESFIQYILNEDPQKSLYEAIVDTSNQHLIVSLERYSSIIPIFVTLLFFVLIQAASRIVNYGTYGIVYIIFHSLRATSFLTITAVQEPVESISLEKQQ